MDSFRDTDRVDADIIVETIDDDFAVAVVEAVTMGDADDGDSAFVMLIRTMLTHSVPLIDLRSAPPHTAPDCASSGGPFFMGSLFVIMMYLRGYLVISGVTEFFNFL